MMWRPSGESVAMSIPRERGGVGERDVRGVWIDHHPSGESKRPAFRESATESQSESCGVPRSHHVHSARANRHPAAEATIPSLSSAKTGDFLRHNKSWRTNRPQAPQFQFFYFSTAPVGAHQTFGNNTNHP